MPFCSHSLLSTTARLAERTRHYGDDIAGMPQARSGVALLRSVA